MKLDDIQVLNEKAKIAADKVLESHNVRTGYDMALEVKNLAAAMDEALIIIGKLAEGLEFYGDPMTYFAISVLGDPPCGEFADDYSVATRLEDGVTGEFPGDLARRILYDIGW